MAQPLPRAEAALSRRPALSILVPTYNRARFIRRSLEHHLESFTAAGIDFEMQVSDNGSTDATASELARFGQHPALRVVRQPENVGAYGNVLYGFRTARGRYAAYVGDDDLLMPDKVAPLIAHLDANPDIVMAQAPWLLIDETKGDAIIGQFYQLDRPYHFARGTHADCLDLLLARHVFPESFIIRTDAIPRVIGPAHEHAFVFFTQLSRALDLGSVYFHPEPFARMTSVTAGDNTHAGNSETMTGWDRYRGGLEFLTARARELSPQKLADTAALLARLQRFVCARMLVALRLHLSARNWRTVHYLSRRLAAYGVAVPFAAELEHLQTLAALETAFAEARLLRRDAVVLDPKVPMMFVEALSEAARPSILRPDDAAARSPIPKAHVCLDRAACGAMAPDDILIDLGALIEQYA